MLKLILRLSIALSLFLGVQLAYGQFIDSGTADPDRIGDPEPWVEPEFGAPKYPNDKDLVKVPVEPSFTFRMKVDKSSIAVKNGLTRLIYVLESKSGARNVFVDGFRCNDKHYTTYATGGSDGNLYPAASREWVRIDKALVHNNYRLLWFTYYLCDYHNNNRQPRDILSLVYNPDYAPDPENK